MPGKKHDREPSSFQLLFCSVTVVTSLQRSWQQRARLAVAEVAAQLLPTIKTTNPMDISTMAVGRRIETGFAAGYLCVDYVLVRVFV